MQALPDLLADGLPVRLDVRVDAVERSPDGWVVRSSAGDVRARAVVVATDPSSAADAGPVDAPTMKGLATWWFSVDEAPATSSVLHVDEHGTASGPVVNAAVVSHAAPGVRARRPAPGAGEHAARPGRGARARRRCAAHLTRLFRTSAARWEVVRCTASPRRCPPCRRRWTPARPVDLGDGLFVAGDHRDTASIQGALVSGRRAATAALAPARCVKRSLPTSCALCSNRCTMTLWSRSWWSRRRPSACSKPAPRRWPSSSTGRTSSSSRCAASCWPTTRGRARASGRSSTG